jgi:hypothetical protein
MKATPTEHVPLAGIELPQVLLVSRNGAVTSMLVIEIAVEEDLLVRFTFTGLLWSVAMTLPKLIVFFETTNLGPLESGDDAASSADCARTGRANAPIRNNSAKARAANERTNDLSRM